MQPDRLARREPIATASRSTSDRPAEDWSHVRATWERGKRSTLDEAGEVRVRLVEVMVVVDVGL